MDKIIRFSVSLPDALLGALDDNVIKKGYASRSEFIRDLIREQITEEKWAGAEEEVMGVLTLIYDHHQPELARKMIDIQHRPDVNVACTTHIHIDHHNCLETIIIRGKPHEIETISIQIGGLKGVKFAKLTKTASVDL